MTEEMEEARAKVLPIYFVADESASMRPVLGELNEGLRNLLDGLHEQSYAASKIRLTILGFSDTTTCYLQLADVGELKTMPEFSAYNSTSYESVFNELCSLIPEHVASLKSKGFLVHRPAVFFLTDGAPNAGESWRKALEKLKNPEFREHPNIISFGVSQADPNILIEVASKEDYALIAEEGKNTGDALVDFSVALTNSIVNSGQAVANGKSELQMEMPRGFVLANDVL